MSSPIETKRIRDHLQIEAPTAELPAVTSDDNGDILTVVEGAWAKAAAPVPVAELLAVTSDDNGDILTVVEGAWAKAAAPSGNDKFKIVLSTSDWTTWSCNVTFSEIQTAVTAGKDFDIYWSDGLGPNNHINEMSVGAEDIYFRTTQFNADNNSFYLYTWRFNLSDSVESLTCSYKQYSLTVKT